MRHRLHIILALMSCCILCFTQSCSSDKEGSEQANTDAKDNDDGDKAFVPSNPNKAKDDHKKDNKPTDPALVPDMPLPPPPPPLPPPFPGGGGDGGGSQGALKPARTGNDDDDRRHGPHGVCGNGVQEVLPDNANCPFDIYGATINAETEQSSLVGFERRNDGAGALVAVIGPNVERVSAIDFAPDGTLYGVAETISNDTSVFISINCRSGEATIIGPTGAPGIITDIDFDSAGRLFAYVASSPQQVGLINPITGTYVELGVSGLSDIGNGLGSVPFPADVLYEAGNTNVSVVNKLTGVATPGPALVFPAPANNSPSINAMDADYFTNIMYVSVNNTTSNYLGTLNVNSGVVSFLASIPPEAPLGLDAIAVNRRYEECDPQASAPALPVGTSCTENCTVIESQCDDGLDNDEDTLIDCLDPDCQGQACNDSNGCTVDDACVNNECIGTPVNCENIIGNECSVDTCQSISTLPGNDNFKCNSVLDLDKTDFGSCTPRRNCEREERNDDGTCPFREIEDHCIIGRCIQDLDHLNDDDDDAGRPVFTCEAASKTAIPEEDEDDDDDGDRRGGCVDDNTCTADGCNARTGACEHDTMVGEICTDGNDCTSGDICVAVNNFDVECVGLPTISGSSCDDGNQCTSPDTCNGSGSCGGVDLSNTTPCDDGNLCTSTDTCNGDGACIGTNNTNSCNSGSSCGTCAGGSCNTIDNGYCNGLTSDGPCTVLSCTENGCEATLMSGPTPCTVIVGLNTCNGFMECSNGEPESACVQVSPPVCTPTP